MRKAVFGLIVLLIFGFVFTGCATTGTNAPPSYQFDGTAWTKTEDYELVGKDGKVEIFCGSQSLGWWIWKQDIGDSWELNGAALTIGNGNWRNFKGHLSGGTWTLASGTPGTGNMDGTTWTRTAVLEISFSNGKMIAKDGANITSVNQDGDSFRLRSDEISISYSDGTARGKYVVDGAALTITSKNTFGVTRLEGSPWTKK
ncbi:MAG: hypothetical protein LBL44_07385 [Treponema sp.]|jgi:hypothetical protein|nr:hypothetical protein [Treponema sp.]